MNAPYDKTFYEGQRDGSYRSAKAVLRIFFQYFRPTSIVDVGCGVGTWLRVCDELGVSDILGLDGSYVRSDMLQIDPKHFQPHDLENEPIRLKKKYDLAISLEVAEHLRSERAASFVKELCTLSDFILFSAAIPMQGGQHHVNEQWPRFWIKLFEKNKFQCNDFLRSKIWDLKEVEYWYKQNILLFYRHDKKSVIPSTIIKMETNELTPVDFVHPENWLSKVGNTNRNSYHLTQIIRLNAPEFIRKGYRFLLKRR